MKENNNIEKLDKKLWEALEVLHSSSAITHMEAFKVILALFVYKRVSSEWDKLMSYPLDQFFIQLEHGFNQLLTKKKLPKLNLKQFNNRLPNNTKEYLIKFFNGMDLSIGEFGQREYPSQYTTDDLNEFVDDFFWRYFSQHPSDIFENKSLNRLAIELLAPRTNETLYFPQCGLGDILIQASKYYDRHFDYFSEEDQFFNASVSISNADIGAIVVLRMLLEEITISIKKEDCFSAQAVASESNGKPSGNHKEFTLDNKSFIEELKRIQNSLFDKFDSGDDFINALPHLADVIFLISPFVLKSSSNIRSTISVKDRVFEISPYQSELFLLLQSLKHLYKKGRIGIVLTPYALFKETSTHKKVREFLVEEDLLEAIVQLPSGIFPQTNLKFVLMIINAEKPKEKKRKFAFMMVKAQRKGNVNVITDDSINKAIYVYKNFSSLSNDYIASIKEIQQQGYNLLPSLYMGAIAEEIRKLRRLKTGRKLKEISKVIRGKPIEISGKVNGIPVISTKNLSKDIKDLYLTLDDVSYADTKLFQQSIIKQKCIIVSLVGNELKPTIFDPNISNRCSEILLGKNVAAIFPKEGVVDFEYLYYQLNSTLIKTQFEESLASAGIPNISQSRLEEIIVPVLDKIEQQQSFAYQQKMELLKAEESKYEALRERLQIDQEKQSSQYEVLGFVAHTVKNDMPIAIQTIEWIREFLEERKLLVQHIFEEQSAGDLLEKARKALKQINSVVKNVRDLVSREFKREDFQELKICELFENEIRSLIKKDYIKMVVKCDVSDPVRIHRDAFIWAISNILHNAEIHGFPNQVDKAEVRFDIHTKENKMVIDYTNNGIPLPKDINTHNYTAFGKKSRGSSGYGLGGAIVLRVIKDVHGGTFDVIRDKNPIHLRMTIPIGD